MRSSGGSLRKSRGSFLRSGEPVAGASLRPRRSSPRERIGGKARVEDRRDLATEELGVGPVLESDRYLWHVMIPGACLAPGAHAEKRAQFKKENWRVTVGSTHGHATRGAGIGRGLLTNTCGSGAILSRLR